MELIFYFPSSCVGFSHFSLIELCRLRSLLTHIDCQLQKEIHGNNQDGWLSVPPTNCVHVTNTKVLCISKPSSRSVWHYCLDGFVHEWPLLRWKTHTTWGGRITASLHTRSSFLVAKCISPILPTTGHHGNLIHVLTELQIEAVTTGFHLSANISLCLSPISKTETQLWFKTYPYF